MTYDEKGKIKIEPTLISFFVDSYLIVDLKFRIGNVKLTLILY